MPIAWKTLPLLATLESVDRKVDEIKPLIAEARAEIALAKQAPNLPQYVTQRLDRLDYDLKATPSRLKQGISSARSAIPKDAIEREHNLPAEIPF